MKYLIDSYAWIEYLDGSIKGEKVKQILNSSSDIYSINLSLTEVVSRVRRENKDSEVAYQAIISNSRVLDISPELAKLAGLFHATMRSTIKDFGIVDSLLYTLARHLSAKIVTGDKHFKNMKNVIFLE